MMMRWMAILWLVGMDLVASSPMSDGGHLEFALTRRRTSWRQRMLEDEGYLELASIKRENDGVYWADIRIGDPPQMFSVIVDTGSSTIAVPCKNCKCGAQHHYFDLDASNGATNTHRPYSQCYSEGSCNRGDYIQAKMCMGESCDVQKEGVEHTFGCCSTFAPAFQKQEADGIVGMSGGDETLIADLRSHHKLANDIFSLCLSDSVGVLGVGGFDQKRHMEPIQWVPLRPSRDFYTVKVEDIYVDGNRINAGSIPLPIVDSGTTFTYVPQAVFNELRSQFERICADADRCTGQMDPPNALKMDIRDSVKCFAPPPGTDPNKLDSWLNTFPSIEIEYEAYEGTKAKLCIPSSAYFFRSSKDAYCLGLLNGRARFVLGAITMNGMDVIFDHQNKRIGMATAACSKDRQIDATYGSAKSTCCGSCAKARAEGFKVGVAGTPGPTLSPVAPTPSPKIAYTTPDGHFQVATNVSEFPGKTVYYPVNGTTWDKGTIQLGESDVLYIQDQSGVLCHEKEKDDVKWDFHENAQIIVKGLYSAIKLGFGCQYPTIDVGKAASVQTVAVKGDFRRRLDSRRPSEARNELTIKSKLIVKGEFHLNEHATLMFLKPDAVDSSTTALFMVHPGARVVCKDTERENMITFNGGHVIFYGGSEMSCFLTIGTHGTFKTIPNAETGVPVITTGTVNIQGSLTLTILRMPFASFSLLAKNSLLWDHHFKTTLQVELDDAGTIITDLPEKARLFTVSFGGIQDRPTNKVLPAEFTCANVTWDDTKGSNEDDLEQLIFTSESCLNKCIDDSMRPCSAQEMLRYPWPPGGTSNIHDKQGINSNASIYDSFIDKVSSVTDRPEASRALVTGSIFGVLAGIGLFLIVYPPNWLKRLLCCLNVNRYRTRYDRI